VVFELLPDHILFQEGQERLLPATLLERGEDCKCEDAFDELTVEAGLLLLLHGDFEGAHGRELLENEGPIRLRVLGHLGQEGAEHAHHVSEQLIIPYRHNHILSQLIFKVHHGQLYLSDVLVFRHPSLEHRKDPFRDDVCRLWLDWLLFHLFFFLIEGEFVGLFRVGDFE